MEVTNSKNAQAGYKKNYDKYVRFNSRFAAGDYFFVEHSPIVTVTAYCMAFDRYSKLLFRDTGLKQVMIVGPRHAKIYQNSIWNTVSCSWLARRDEEEV